MKATLYGILDFSYLGKREAAVVAQQMIDGGVEIIQLRGKDQPLDQIRSVAKKILPLTSRAKVPLIINDHAKIAAEIGADGVHVGQDDLSVAEARAILGPRGLVGKSTHSLDQALKAQAERADYIGVGPVYA